MAWSSRRNVRTLEMNGQGMGLIGFLLGFCGNSIEHNGTLLTAETTPSNQTCQMRCRGSEPEICGGAHGLSLYNNTAFKPPKVKTPIGKYGSSQCVTDPNTNGRALQGTFMTNANMTNEMCVKYCLGQEYHYAGYVHFKACLGINADGRAASNLARSATAVRSLPSSMLRSWADNDIGNSIVASTGATQISCSVGDLMRCPGNAYEFCGGSSLLNLYYSATL